MVLDANCRGLLFVHFSFIFSLIFLSPVDYGALHGSAVEEIHNAAQLFWCTKTTMCKGTTGVPREDSRGASGSIGFLDAELAMPELNPCDASNSDQESRLCWHTYGQGGGYRCGADSGTSQNWEKGWERLIFQSDRTA